MVAVERYLSIIGGSRNVFIIFLSKIGQTTKSDNEGLSFVNLLRSTAAMAGVEAEKYLGKPDLQPWPVKSVTTSIMVGGCYC